LLYTNNFGIRQAEVKQNFLPVAIQKESRYYLFNSFVMKGETIMKPSATITMIFLLLVSAVHLLRLVFQWKVIANTVEIPLWMSAAACIVTAALAIWLWRENKPTKL
jgi:hypothetical protein